MPDTYLLHSVTSQGRHIGFMIECPGCAQYGAQHHVIYTEVVNDMGAKWAFNGDLEHPTFSPSVRVTWNEGRARVQCCCHFHIRDGMIAYCSDSTHKLSGQTVPLPRW